ncbi:MAG: hypothetical protein JXR77_03045 [Lentisphaeria bacterium]|nr:hypothetical protein [Lentisphaeria bacterium]
MEQEQPNARITVKFWGTRGTSAPYNGCCAFGFHTTAVEVNGNHGDPIFVDMGTGLGPASHAAVARGVRRFVVFLTHLHLDHVAGACAFVPLHRRDCSVTVYSCHAGTRETIARVLTPPLFPLHFETLPTRPRLEELPESGTLAIEGNGLRVSWCPAAHPQGVTALRFEDGANAFVLATDVELRRREENRRLEALLREPYSATLAAFDGYFSQRHGNYRPGWGHSTWEEAVALAQQNSVQQVVITHHHPRFSDEDLGALEASAGGVRWARDGQCWQLCGGHAEET